MQMEKNICEESNIGLIRDGNVHKYPGFGGERMSSDHNLSSHAQSLLWEPLYSHSLTTVRRIASSRAIRDTERESSIEHESGVLDACSLVEPRNWTGLPRFLRNVTGAPPTFCVWEWARRIE